MTQVAPKEIFKMQNDINFLKKHSYAQARDMREIKTYLIGDQFHEGFKQKNERDRKDIKMLKSFKQRLIYAGWAISGLITLTGITFAIAHSWVKIFGN